MWYTIFRKYVEICIQSCAHQTCSHLTRRYSRKEGETVGRKTWGFNFINRWSFRIQCVNGCIPASTKRLESRHVCFRNLLATQTLKTLAPEESKTTLDFVTLVTLVTLVTCSEDIELFLLYSRKCIAEICAYALLDFIVKAIIFDLLANTQKQRIAGMLLLNQALIWSAMLTIAHLLLGQKSSKIYVHPHTWRNCPMGMTAAGQKKHCVCICVCMCLYVSVCVCVCVAFTCTAIFPACASMETILSKFYRYKIKSVQLKA